MDFDINRFIKAQDGCFEEVLKELNNGRKTTHWIWFIFPQIKGLGLSYYSNYYGISSIEEAKAYMENDTLRKRYLMCCEALIKHKDEDINIILSDIDASKLRSSLTLFSHMDFEGNELLKELLNVFYDGLECKKTLEFLNK